MMIMKRLQVVVSTVMYKLCGAWLQVAPEVVPDFLPTLAEVADLEHFSHCRNLQETIWKQLPSIALGLGKRV
jgi:hypothetical protein